MQPLKLLNYLYQYLWVRKTLTLMAVTQMERKNCSVQTVQIVDVIDFLWQTMTF